MHSSGHPDITNNIPRTEKAIGSKKRTAKKPKRGGKRKRGNERLTVYDITQLIQAKKIRTRLELVSLAVIQNKDGNTSLAQFIANRGSAAVDEALSLAKEFSEAGEKFSRSQKSRVQILREAFESNCVAGCEGKW